MIITKRIERLYSLAQYENIKIVVEAIQDIWETDPKEWYNKLTEILWDEIKSEKEKIKPTEKVDWPFN